MTNGVVATLKALKEEKVVCVRKASRTVFKAAVSMSSSDFWPLQTTFYTHNIVQCSCMSRDLEVTLKSMIYSNDYESIYSN